MIIKGTRPLLLVALLVVSGCRSEVVERPSSDQFLEGCRHVDKAAGFSVKIPPGWEKKAMPGKAVMGMGPLKRLSDRVFPSVIVAVDQLPPNTSLETYCQHGLANVKADLSDFRELESGTEKVGGAEARRVVYSYRQGTEKIKACIHLLVEGNQGYSIICLAAQKEYSEHRAGFAEVVRSFRRE